MSLACPICESNSWKNVDQYRIKPSGMCLCQTCGMVTYPELWESEEKMLQYYREKYRAGAAPNAGNLFSGQRKLHFHEAFIGDIMEKWRTDGTAKDRKVFEVGAAYGMALNWIKNRSGGAQVNGSELTTSYRRNAFWEYDLELGEEFVPDKYDLIMSYKVLEHQLNPLQKLRQYAECLKPGGLLYIGVPIWFISMSNFGKPGWDIEYYYSKDHINVWTRTLFQTLLKKAGLKIVRFNDVFYDDSYLCERDDSLMNEKPVYEDPAKVEELLKKTKLASDHYMDSQFGKALEVWPNFPDAHVNHYETTRAKWNSLGWDAIKRDVIDAAISCCPDNGAIMAFAGDIHMRYDKFTEAVGYINQCLTMKPGHPNAIIQMFHCQMALARKAKTKDEEMFYLNEAKKAVKHLRAVSAQHFREAMDFLYLVNSKVETPSEMPAQKPVAEVVPIERGKAVIEASP